MRSNERGRTVLADIGMEHTDGFDLIKRFDSRASAVGKYRRGRTAYARAKTDEGVAERLQMHLAKPVDPAELIVAVASLAKRTVPAPE